MSDDAIINIAARSGTVDDVRRLIEFGADVNLAGDMGFTPLQEAASRGRVEIVRLLLDAGADRSLRNEWGHTVADSLRLGRETMSEEQHDAIARLLAGERRPPAANGPA